MSIRTACSYVPEMILDAPKELKRVDGARKLHDCAGVAFIRMIRVGCIVTVRLGEGVVLKKRPDGAFSAPVAVSMFGPYVFSSQEPWQLASR